MIQETSNRKNEPAITSNQWHVVHARWSGDPNGKPLFLRSIVSEHENHATAECAREILAASLVNEMAARPDAARDQVFVRKPTYKSLKTARRLADQRK